MMHIDRTRFLLLSASMASCTPQPAGADDVEVKPVDIEPSSNDPFVVERTSAAPEPKPAGDAHLAAGKAVAPAAHAETPVAEAH